jgi:hypothetical protein
MSPPGIYFCAVFLNTNNLQHVADKCCRAGVISVLRQICHVYTKFRNLPPCSPYAYYILITCACMYVYIGYEFRMNHFCSVDELDGRLCFDSRQRPIYVIWQSVFRFYIQVIAEYETNINRRFTRGRDLCFITKLTLPLCPSIYLPPHLPPPHNNVWSNQLVCPKLCMNVTM